MMRQVTASLSRWFLSVPTTHQKPESEHECGGEIAY